MKSTMKRMVRAYDKELKIFLDLRNSKKKRRKQARECAKEWHDDNTLIESQVEADELAHDNIYYTIN